MTLTLASKQCSWTKSPEPSGQRSFDYVDLRNLWPDALNHIQYVAPNLVARYDYCNTKFFGHDLRLR